jgi:hypothetical protein
MARTRPPKETMLTAPAPALASGTLELEVGLLEPPVEPEPEEPEPEEPEALAAGPLGEAPLPVGAGTVALPPLGGVTMGVTPGAPGAMGVAVGTTTVPVFVSVLSWTLHEIAVKLTRGLRNGDAWDNRSRWRNGGDRRSWSGNHRGHGDGSGRRSLDLAIGDLGDGLDRVLRHSGNGAGEEGDRGGGETHLDYGCGRVVGIRDTGRVEADGR